VAADFIAVGDGLRVHGGFGDRLALRGAALYQREFMKIFL
jgi:hypothetical protein